MSTIPTWGYGSQSEFAVVVGGATMTINVKNVATANLQTQTHSANVLTREAQGISLFLTGRVTGQLQGDA